MSKPTDAPWIRRPSVLEPPTLGSYERLRRNRRWWAIAAIILACWLGGCLFWQLLENYRRGGNVKQPAPKEQKL